MTRDSVATPWSVCKSCGKGTRSHVLEPAKYEEFIAEEIIGQSDEFASKAWEEVDEVVKYRLATEPIVLCHVCWDEQQIKLERLVEESIDKWLERPIFYANRIHAIIDTCSYYKFEKLDFHCKRLLNSIKEATK